MSRSDSSRRRPEIATRMRSGPAFSTRSVVRGTISVDGWPASSKACACSTSTGRVFPGSVPRAGLRLASQISPLFAIRVVLDGRKFGIYAHALVSNPARSLRHPVGQEPCPRLLVHALDGEADVFRPRQTERPSALTAGLSQGIG